MLIINGLKFYKKGVVKFYINNVVNDNLLLDEILNEENEDDNNDECEITHDFRNALVYYKTKIHDSEPIMTYNKYTYVDN